MNTVTLTQEELAQIDQLIQEMPVKYGLPLINLINKIIQDKHSHQLGEVPQTNKSVE